MTVSHQFTLPFPVSVNAIYGGGSGQKRFKTKAALAWEAKARLIKLAQLRNSRPCQIEYVFYWPDKRTRDGQNYMKQPLDYLVARGVLADDNNQIVVSESWRSGGLDKVNPRVEILLRILPQ